LGNYQRVKDVLRSVPDSPVNTITPCALHSHCDCPLVYWVYFLHITIFHVFVVLLQFRLRVSRFIPPCLFWLAVF